MAILNQSASPGASKILRSATARKYAAPATAHVNSLALSYGRGEQIRFERDGEITEMRDPGSALMGTQCQTTLWREFNIVGTCTPKSPFDYPKTWR